MFRNGLPLLDPDNIDTLETFDLRYIVPQSRENERGAIGAGDPRFADGIETTKLQCFLLFRQQPMDAVGEGILEFARTENSQWFCHAAEQQRARDAPRLPRSTSAVDDFVARGIEQKGELNRQDAGPCLP